MQQFTIPQFIDVEDKIIGPITARQFIVMLAGFITLGIFYKFFDFALFVTSAVIVIGIVALFSFVKVNGRPFHFFLINVIQTLKRPKLRIWNKFSEIKFTEEKSLIVNKKSENIPLKNLEKSRLNELSLVVDTQGVYRGEGKFKSDISGI